MHDGIVAIKPPVRDTRGPLTADRNGGIMNIMNI
jgi:hypothetical protein